MNNRGEPKPPAAWLDALHSSEQWERLIDIARRSLAVDPNDAGTHRHLAWAYAKTERFTEMAPHVEFLLRADPESVPNQHVAAVYTLEVGAFTPARTHVNFLLARSPRTATFHYLASILALRTDNLPQARKSIREARQLAPQWAAAALLEVRMDGIGPQQAWEGWKRARRLEEILALEPRNARVLANLGVIYLNELEQPRKAETFFRQSLSIDPSDQETQKNLLTTFRARSLIYRTLSLPTRMVRYFWKRPVPMNGAGFLLLLVWAIWVGIYFAPAAWIYERMVLTDYLPVRWRVLAPLARMLRWPSWVRLLFSLTLISGLIWLALWKWVGLKPWSAVAIMAEVFGFHFAFVCWAVGMRKMRVWRGRRKAAQAAWAEVKPVESMGEPELRLER